MKNTQQHTVKRTGSFPILVFAASLIIPLVVTLPAGLAAEGEPTVDFPEELSGSMTYIFQASDPPGVWNFPNCNNKKCTTELVLNFKLAETDGDQAEYKAEGGGWRVTGTGTGGLTETFAEETCEATVKEEYSGTGSFSTDGLDSASLSYNRSSRSFSLAFMISSAKVHKVVTYTCMGQGMNNTFEYYAMGDASGVAELSDGDLIFKLQSTRSWTNINIERSRYDGIASGKLSGAGLKADFSYSPPTRGKVSLDASNSTGKIKKYTWTFSGATEEKSIKFNGDAKLEGKKVDVVLLVPLTVKLTVEDQKGAKKSKEKKVGIQPRDWKTVAEHQKEHGAFDSVVFKAKNGEAPMGAESARNSCAYNDNHPGLIFHPPGEGSGFDRTFENIGYTIDDVSDGPFKGTFYIKESKVEIIRKAFLNSNFFAGTAFYELNIKLNSGIEKFIESTKEHEIIHTELLQEALKDQNPAKQLEKLFGQDHDSLKKDADKMLSTMETALKEIYENEDTVKSRMRKKYGNEKSTLVFENVDEKGKTITKTPIIERSYFLYNKSQSSD